MFLKEKRTVPCGPAPFVVKVQTKNWPSVAMAPFETVTMGGFIRQKVVIRVGRGFGGVPVVALIERFRGPLGFGGVRSQLEPETVDFVSGGPMFR